MNSTDFSILKVQEEDVLILQNVVKVTFIQAFRDQNSQQDMDLYLAKHMSIGAIEKEYYTEDSEFFISRLQSELCGYLKINEGLAQTDLKESEGMEIERIYLLKEFQNQGFGQLLLDFGIQRAIQSGKKYVWLGVWEQNVAAIRFYERNGFYKFDTHNFLLGTDQQTDFLMRKDLQPLSSPKL